MCIRDRYKYVEDRYVEKYCTEEQKKDVTQMVEDIIAAYRTSTYLYI